MIVSDPDRAAPFYQARRQKAQQKIAQIGLDALVVSSLVNIRYLTGFSGTAALVVVTPEETYFFTDFRYTTQAVAQVRGADMREMKESLTALADLFTELKAARVGFEQEEVTVGRATRMEKKLDGVTLVPIDNLIEKVRLIKDEAEVEVIRWLIGILERVYPFAQEQIRPGRIERDVAIEIEHRLKQEGADGAAFDFIVASGPRSAMPHGVASEKVIATDELVTLDWGCKGFGYHSDNTRTFATGAVGPELRAIYDIVLEANRAAIEFVRPGVTVKQVDTVARDIIVKAGYGGAFGHGTGHGVGLDIHEKPSVSWREETVVEEGMVFTIEPGIYLPGKGGVRIEDMVAVTATGCELLSKNIGKEYTLLAS